MGSKNRLKQPQVKAGTLIKPPAAGPAGSTNHQHPVFCFRHLRNIDDCEGQELAALGRTLHGLAQMTWQQISLAPKSGRGSEFMPVDQIKVSLGDLAEREGRVMVLRYNGKAPMLGLREGALFQILWLDHDFTAYDHGS